MKEAYGLCFLLFIALCKESSSNSCKTLYILQVVPFHTPQEDGWDRGLEVIPAGRVALRHINGHPELLKDLELEIINVPSNSCAVSSPYVPFVEVMSLVTSSKQKCVFGIVGLYCSSVTRITVPPFSHEKFGFVQLTSSTSPDLLNTGTYPYLFKTIASSEIYNMAAIRMMNFFNWTRISIVFDYSQFFFRSTGMSFSRLIDNHPNITRLAQIPLADDSLEEIRIAFGVLFNRASRIAYFSVPIEESGKIICEAYRLNLTWPWYAYIFADRTLQEVLSYNGNCSLEEMKSAVEGVFFFRTKLSASEDSILVSGKSFKEYYKEYLEELRIEEKIRHMNLTENEYANSLYDQVWAFALAMNDSLRNIDTTVNDSFTSIFHQIPGNREVMTDALQQVSFQGATGIINFGTRQEALSSVEIFQARNGTMISIGLFDPYNQDLIFNDNFKVTDIPSDSFDTVPYHIPWVIGMIAILFQGVLLAIILMSILAMVYWRKQAEVKSSSLYISFVILAGCLLLTLSPVTHTVIGVFDIPQEAYSILCNMDLWFSLYGITLIVTALLFRLLRIAHVFSSYHSTGKHWADKYLLFYISVTSGVSLLFLVVWVGVDPVRLISTQVYQSSAIPPFFQEYRYCSCDNLGVWLAVSLAWIALLMSLVLFLAIQTRKIKRRHFKDTKKVNVFVFSSCIIFALFVPLSYLLQVIDYHLVAFLFSNLSYFTIVLLCQVLLFLPKYIPLLYKKKSKTYSVSSAIGQLMRSSSDGVPLSTRSVIIKHF